MENAAEALKMAAFVLLFLGALSIAMFTLSKARTTSQEILELQDNRNSYAYIENDDYIASNATFKTERVVTFDAILPTIYRYYKENYRVEFYDESGKGIHLYNPRGYLNSTTNALDIDAEMQNNESWQGSPQATKEHLDTIVKSVLMSYSDKKFKEELGIIETENASDDPLLDDINKQTKRVIRYTVVN